MFKLASWCMKFVHAALPGPYYSLGALRGCSTEGLGPFPVGREPKPAVGHP